MSAHVKSWLRKQVMSSDERRILDYVVKSEQLRAMMGTSGRDVPEPSIKGVGPAYQYMEHYGVRRNTNDRELRALSETPTPAACINRLVKDVISTPWKVLPIDPKNKDKGHANAVLEMLYQPNRYDESFETIIAKTLGDILVLDAGVIAKHYTVGDKLSQFLSMDGSAFLKDVDDQGFFSRVYPHLAYDVVIKGQKQTLNKYDYRVGYWQHHMQATVNPIPYSPDEICYFMQYPKTYTIYGQSPVEVLSLRLKTLNFSDISNEKYFRNGEVAKQLLSNEMDKQILEEADYKRWITRLDNAIKEPHEIVPTDVRSKLYPLGYSRKDFQWLEQQEEYRLSTCALFNVTPVMLGWTTRDVTKATDESQREVYMQKGLWPLLQLIEWHVNMGIITELFKDATPDVYFTFDLYDPVDETRWIERCKIAAECGLKTVNEMRAERDMPPVKWGNINPAAIVAIQQFAQSVATGGMSKEQFTLTTGIPSLGELLKQTDQPVEATPSEKAKFWSVKWDAWRKRRRQR